MIDWTQFDAVLFDLDGVLTPTAVAHRQAWKLTFDELLSELEGASFRPFTDGDYFAHVDGKPRYDGVRDFLTSRGITLPEGDPTDPPGLGSVCAVGNTKNQKFQEVLASEGVAPFPGSIRLLDHLESLGLQMGLVSSSANASAVLKAAGLDRRFGVRVDGVVARERDLAGKPAADMFLEAARQLDVDPGRTVVVEDAVSGVAAGRAGGFGLVIGVNRTEDASRLERAGADVVVPDLGELI